MSDMVVLVSLLEGQLRKYSMTILVQAVHSIQTDITLMITTVSGCDVFEIYANNI